MASPKIIHYPVDEDHPRVRPLSRWRPRLCEPNGSTVLDIKYEMEPGIRPQMDGFRILAKRGVWRPSTQRYFTRDKSAVTCKKCKKFLQRLEEHNGNHQRKQEEYDHDRPHVPWWMDEDLED